MIIFNNQMMLILSLMAIDNVKCTPFFFAKLSLMTANSRKSA